MQEEAIELTIDYFPPSPNRINAQHWGVFANESKKAARAVWLAWLRSGKPTAKGRKAKAEFCIYARGQSDDIDNRVARLKRVIDALVRLGVFVDDSEEHLELVMPTREKITGRGYLKVAIQYYE